MTWTALQWTIRWIRSHQAAAAAITAVVLSGLTGYGLYNMHNQLLVCPGCNPPEVLRVDHYTIRNNTNQEPSLLTIWFASTGPAGRSLTVQALYIENGPSKYPDCHWIPYNESSCLTPFTVQGVSLPALSVVPVSIDTGSQGFYFAAGQTYTIDVVTDQSWFGGFRVSYPPVNPDR